MMGRPYFVMSKGCCLWFDINKSHVLIPLLFVPVNMSEYTKALIFS
jgi:hypothetical protein